MSASIDEPHFLQNLESSIFSNWHFGHFIVGALQIVEEKRSEREERSNAWAPNRTNKFYQERCMHILKGFSMRSSMTEVKG
jgi:hypothetical protein